MAITRESMERNLGLPEKTNKDRKEGLFQLTGVWAETKVRAAKSGKPVGPVTERIQLMKVNLFHCVNVSKVLIK